MSSAIKTPAFQAKAGNITNEDGSSIYSNGDWSLKNSTAVARVTIKDDGKVGIGTSSPAAKFSVVGGSITTDASYQFTASSSTPASQAFIYRPVDYTLAFGTDGTERMRIDASGNLLVGTTSVNGKLNILANATGTAIYTSQNNSSRAFVINQTNANTVAIDFLWYGTRIGSITNVGGGSTAYNTGASDYRLKESIQELSGGLEKVKQLRPVSFKWKESGREDFGFIAHEIQQVIPECVSGEKDAVDAEGNPEYQSLFPAPAQMIASLVSAIQEQQAQIEELKAKVSALEAK